MREELYGTANQPVVHRQEGRAGQLAVPGQGRARSQRRRDLHRRAAAEIRHRREPEGPRRAAEGGAGSASPRRRTSRSAFRISAPAARTIPPPWCRRARAPTPASAATTWRSGWTARRSGFTQMGGEGANWIGEAPFSKRPHVFQNIGDGTYNHSGYMAIRASIASGVNVTYKILFNDAVAMTGGQMNDGNLTRAEDRRARSRPKAPSASSSSATSRRNIRPAPNGRRASPSITATICRRCRRSCREIPGCTVLIYDQTCAAEKRRAPEARHVPRSGQARHHQRAGLRGLRRLRREIELRLGAAAGDRIRPQAHHRPVVLQQGLLLREGLLPVVRHRAWRAS